jgi:transmembrane sensor
MKDANIRLNELFQKYLENEISENELAEFSGYVDDPGFTVEVQDLLGKAFKEGNEVLSIGNNGRNRVLKNVLGAEVLDEKPRKLALWPRIAIAAAVATIIFGAGLFYYKQSIKQKQSDQTAYKNDISPGKSGATLTLANGKKIRLDEVVNGKLAEEAGVVITKSANGQLVYEIKDRSGAFNKINTLSTAKGETYRVRLPDGSVVWLNAASSLTYSPNLTSKGKRRVKLEGEGYFEVAKDKNHPFVVESKGQEVEVLGTHFNVNAYVDEPTVATTLLEGSVKVTAANGNQIIKPGEQAINNGATIKVTEANIENITDWKEGDFFLDRVNFKLAMRKIARWYNVEVVYADDVPDALEAGGWISRKNNLSAVLKSIEKSGIAHFKIEGRTLYVSK